MDNKTFAGLLIAGSIAVIAANSIVSSQFQDLVGVQSTFDSDEDRINRNVNTSWIYIETGDWKVDPSDTNSQQVKLEQDGRGLITLPKQSFQYNETVYYDSVSWEERIQQFERQGFDLESQPRVVSHNDRRFWSMKLSRTTGDVTAYMYFFATYKNNSQYTFLYSYTPQYAPSGHYDQVLARLANASLK